MTTSVTDPQPTLRTASNPNRANRGRAILYAAKHNTLRAAVEPSVPGRLMLLARRFHNDQSAGVERGVKRVPLLWVENETRVIPIAIEYSREDWRALTLSADEACLTLLELVTAGLRVSLDRRSWNGFGTLLSLGARLPHLCDERRRSNPSSTRQVHDRCRAALEHSLSVELAPAEQCLAASTSATTGIQHLVLSRAMRRLSSAPPC